LQKLKSHSGAKKRFRISATGKIKFKKTHAQHLLAKKSAKRMRRLRKPAYLKPRQRLIVERLIPYTS